MPVRNVWIVTVSLLAAPLLAQTSATVVVGTQPAGASVLVDGVEQGTTPATVLVNLPDGQPREVLLEVKLSGRVGRAARVVLGPGETLVWTGVNLAAGDGATVRPTELTRPVAPTAEAFPPAGWPGYLMGYRPPAGLRFRVSGRDQMPQVLLPAGAFTMGSTAEQVEQAIRLATQTGTPEEVRLRSEGPAHQVRLSACWMDLHEVTCEQYCRFLNELQPSAEERQSWVVVRGEAAKNIPFQPLLELREGRYAPLAKYEQHPVTFVSWVGATAYAQWAGRRLPTEAEWERAARGGQPHRFWAWPDEAPPHSAGNFCDTTHVQRFPAIKRPGRYFLGYEDGYEGTAPVCSFAPNGLGLFDLMGNVWEWCQDTYDAGFYAKSPALDPVNEGPSQLGRVVRGGAFMNAPWSVRPACRLFEQPAVNGVFFGFRCAASPETAR